MRNYGRFTTSIYRDDDYRALTAEQQGVYFMLGLQPDVTAAGTLPVTLRRWAGMSEGMTPDGLRDQLKVLEERGHILIDEDTEELLIVKFVKFDGGIGNEKRRPVIEEAACAIASARIRHRLAYELSRLGYPDMASKLSGDVAPDAQSGFDRVVVNQGDQIPQPLTATPVPFTATPEGEPSADGEPAPPMFCPKHPNGTEHPCGACARARTRYAQHIQETAGREAEAKQARAAAIRACDECDEFGRTLHPETGKPIGRCDHPRVRRAS